MYEKRETKKRETKKVLNILLGKKERKRERPQKVAEYTASYCFRKNYIFVKEKNYERPQNVTEYTACC